VAGSAWLIIFLMTAFAATANATDLIGYYNFEGAATTGFPVNATSHAPAFFDGSDAQHSSTLLGAANFSMVAVTPGLPQDQIGSTNNTALGFNQTMTHSPGDLDIPLGTSGRFQDMTLSFAINKPDQNGYNLVKVFYSTNGGGLFAQFGPAGGVAILTSSAGQLVSQAVPAAANNASNLVLRIELSGGMTAGNTLQNAMDNIQVNSTIIPAVFTVTKTADTNDGVCDSDCSLREAITAANSAGGPVTIQFSIPTNDPGYDSPNDRYTITLESELPNLNGNISINGLGANRLTAKRDSAAATTIRIFTINSGKTVTISGLTITNGVAGGSSGEGGGIFNAGTLTINNSTLSGNSAGLYGGGIFNAGTLTINNSTLSGNSANFGSGSDGGGIFNAGPLTITNSTLSGNSAVSYGGGIFSQNFVEINNSTLSGNSAGIDGGGIYNSAGGSPTLSIGGTILTSTGSNITNNSNGMVTSLGYNLSSDAAGGDGTTGPGGFLNATGDQRNTNPMLDPNGLQDNGGPTLTIKLQSGSPAIDKGKNFSGSNTDQRGAGFARTFDNPSIANVSGGDGTDIGAFEVQNVAPSITGATISRTQGASANSQIATVSDDHDQPTALSVTVNGGNSATVNGVTVSNIAVANSGNVTADVVASCSASNASFTLRVTDTGGLHAEATLTVNVTANQPPVISVFPPPDQPILAQKKKVNKQKGAYVFFNVSATDPEDGPVTATANPPSGSFFPVGTTTVTVTASDHCGNTSTATFTITVTTKKKRHK
jgi:CSLREA domain-containing protein